MAAAWAAQARRALPTRVPAERWLPRRMPRPRSAADSSAWMRQFAGRLARGARLRAVMRLTLYAGCAVGASSMAWRIPARRQPVPQS